MRIILLHALVLVLMRLDIHLGGAGGRRVDERLAVGALLADAAGGDAGALLVGGGVLCVAGDLGGLGGGDEALLGAALAAALVEDGAEGGGQRDGEEEADDDARGVEAVVLAHAHRRAVAVLVAQHPRRALGGQDRRREARQRLAGRGARRLLRAARRADCRRRHAGHRRGHPVRDDRGVPAVGLGCRCGGCRCVVTAV